MLHFTTTSDCLPYQSYTNSRESTFPATTSGRKRQFVDAIGDEVSLATPRRTHRPTRPRVRIPPPSAVDSDSRSPTARKNAHDSPQPKALAQVTPGAGLFVNDDRSDVRLSRVPCGRERDASRRSASSSRCRTTRECRDPRRATPRGVRRRVLGRRADGADVRRNVGEDDVGFGSGGAPRVVARARAASSAFEVGVAIPAADANIAAARGALAARGTATPSSSRSRRRRRPAWRRRLRTPGPRRTSTRPGALDGQHHRGPGVRRLDGGADLGVLLGRAHPPRVLHRRRPGARRRQGLHRGQGEGRPSRPSWTSWRRWPSGRAARRRRRGPC